MPTKLHFVKAARKAIFKKTEQGEELLIDKGESYFWWKFKNRPKCVSKEKPDPSRLKKYGKTEWEEKFDEFNQRFQDCSDEDSFEDLKTEVEEYKDELQERFDNIPQALQESSNLNEKIEDLDTLIQEIEHEISNLYEED